MSRGLANQRLYLARLLLSAWERDRAAESIPAIMLDQAYAPGTREHLIAAYGHFLCYVFDPTGAATAGAVPRSCSDLPAQAAGQALPGEIREFRLLEQEGWLGELLAPLPVAGPSVSQRRPEADTLAVSTAVEWPTPDQMEDWYQRLRRIFQRMDDSIEEC